MEGRAVNSVETLGRSVARDSIAKFVEDYSPAGVHIDRSAKSRFLFAVMPQFDTVQDLLTADQSAWARRLGRRCGPQTIVVWDAVRDFICFERVRDRNRRRAAEELVRSASGDDGPYIELDALKEAVALMEHLNIPGMKRGRLMDIISPPCFIGSFAANWVRRGEETWNRKDRPMIGEMKPRLAIGVCMSARCERLEVAL